MKNVTLGQNIDIPVSGWKTKTFEPDFGQLSVLINAVLLEYKYAYLLKHCMWLSFSAKEDFA